MPIVSSLIVSASRQRDGRRSVHERHVDHAGGAHERHYLVTAAEDDVNAALAAYAARLPGELAVAEIGGNVASVLSEGSFAALTFVHSTVGENRAALRAAYQNVTRIEAIMIGDFLSALTDGQLRAIFGMTQAQVTTLRENKLTPAATLASNIRAANGA